MIANLFSLCLSLFPAVAQLPQAPTQEVSFDLSEGTWMNLDVAPDGQELAFDWLGDIYTLPIAGGEARPILTGHAWQMQPRYSPDGARLAFTSDQAGGDNIWIADRDGQNPKQLTKESFRLLNSPAWSPDGQWIVARKHFTSRRSIGTGELFLYHTGGGDGLQLTTRTSEQKDLGEPIFSPDGRYIYFSYDSTPGGTFEYSKDSTGQIYAIDRLDRETGERIPWVTGPGGACRPVPSHDGKQLAFVRRVRFQTVLFVMDMASGAARPIYTELERDMQETWAIHGVYPAFAWTPDDRSLVFYAKGKLHRIEVATGETKPIPFRVRAKRTVEEAVRFPVAVAPDTFDVKVLRSVRVAPDNKSVVYQALGKLWIRALPDGQPKRLTQDEQRFEFFPCFRRDGKELVYIAWDDKELASIRTVALDGSAGRVLNTEPGHYLDPVYTPDGETIVYHKVSGGGLVSPLWSREPGIYAVGAKGGQPRLVTNEGSKPQFAAASDRVYLTSEEGGGGQDPDKRKLWSIGLDGTKPRTHFTSDWATQFELSDDGRWVAFCERFQAYIAPFEATGRAIHLGPKLSSMPLARVSKDAGENLEFSADSSRLYWSLGPELFERHLSESFAFLRGGQEPTPELPMHGRNIGFTYPSDKPTGALAISGARIVTMRGDEVIEDGTIVIEGNRITAVGSSERVAIPAGARVIVANGKTIIPGLIDVHAHGAQAANGITPQSNWVHAANLAFGVTTIHDPSNDTNSIFAASELAKAGQILSPRTYSTGTILYGAMGDFKAEIDSLDDARSHLRRLKAVGAISVKSYNQPRREQRQQVIAAARELGMMVVPEGGSLLQHNLTMVVDGHTGVEHSLPVERIYADVAQLWGATRVGYTPTLVVGYGGIWGENYFYQHSEVWKNERLMHFVPRFVVDPRSRRRTMAPDEDQNILRSAGIVKSILDAGGKAQLGAHGQLAGLGAHWELWLLQRSGITPHQALRCATLYGAEYVGLDRDLGSLEPGKLADLLVLDLNPLEKIENSTSIRFTMLNGRLYVASTLAPADGRPGKAPQFYFESQQEGFPAQTLQAGCAGCAH